MMTTDPRVDMVTFTGSTGVGKAIVAAAAPTLKKVALELGGKNPQVIFADADLESAVDAIVFGVYFNAGECCNSGSRIIVHEDIAGGGDRAGGGAVAQGRLRRSAGRGDQGRRHRLAGAPGEDRRIRAGRGRGGRRGAPRRRRARGAGAGRAVLPADGGRRRHARHGDRPRGGVRPRPLGPDLPHARARRSRWRTPPPTACRPGCGARTSIPASPSRAPRRAGTVWTNTWMDGFAELPFGGVKESGQGRELGRYGLDEFLEVKTVQMRIGRTRAPWVVAG